MSAQTKKQYNLRSHKGKSIQVPVELQVSDDNRFLNTLLENSMLSQQNNSDSSDTDQSVNLNFSDSAQSSDDNDQVPSTSDRTSRSFDKFHMEKSQSTSDSVTSNQASRFDIQSAINVQILTQLDNLGKRLEKIEGKKCKKTSDRSKIKKSQKTVAPVTEISRSKVTLPQSAMSSTTLESMRQDAVLQAKVDERLQELTELAKTGTLSKLKSQRGGKVEVLVKNRVKWPHEFVLSGANKERVTYDQLNVTQWVAGFGRTIREESDPELKAHMLDYMIALMDDANDFSRGSAKASHAVLLCRMEQGEVKNFADTMAIERIRRANAEKFAPANQISNVTGQNFGKKFSKTKACHAITSVKEHVCRADPMRQGGSYTNIYAHLALLVMAKLFHIRKWNAKTRSEIQKTNSSGWADFGAHPEGKNS